MQSVSTRQAGRWRLLWRRGGGLAARTFSSTPSPPPSSSTGVKAQSSKDYCVELVYQKDYDSYLAGLLFPKEHRAAYYAIKAFNVEMATIRDQIPKTAIQAGRLRFQFWRDILGNIRDQKTLGKNVNQPVAIELLQHVKDYQLNVRWLERCLEARYSDVMNNGLLESMDDLENYAEFSHSSINYLLLEVLGIHDENMQYAASHVGVASGITALLRGFAHHSANGSCYLPKNTMLKFALAENIVISGPKSDGDRKKLQDTTHDVASQAYAHLDTARTLLQKNAYKNQGIYALLNAVPTNMYLELLQDHDSDPFATCIASSQRTHLKLQWNLFKTSVTKTF